MGGRFRALLDDLAVDLSFVEDRAGRYPRSLARDRYRRFLRDSWFRLLIILLVGVGLGGLVFFLPSWMQGFIGGIWIASVVWFVALLVIQSAGTAPITMGATAEQWTAQEMRMLRRSGWKVTSHVRPWVKGGDVDHLAIGPGGAVVIESKWVSDERTLQRSDRVEEDRKQLEKSAIRIRNTLRNRLQNAPIRSAVVYWGAVNHADAAVTSVDNDPQVLVGSQLERWLHTISRMPQVVNDEEVQSAWDTITHFLQQTDHQELGENYESKRTLMRRGLDVLLGPFAVLATFWGAALFIGSFGVLALVPLAGLFGIGRILYHIGRAPTATTWRRVGAGVMAASTFIIIVVAALYLGSRLFHF